MSKNIVVVIICLAVFLLGVGIYLFFYLESNEQTDSDQVDMSKVYSIPGSNVHESTQKNIIQPSTNQTSQVAPENGSINKQPLTVKEKKSNLVNKSFITTTKDIATF